MQREGHENRTNLYPSLGDLENAVIYKRGTLTPAAEEAPTRRTHPEFFKKPKTPTAKSHPEFFKK